MFRGLEHPSGFPSMLRGSTPEPRPLSRKDSYGSTNQLKRTDSNGISSPQPQQPQQPLHRKDSSGSTNRRDSYGSNYLTRKDSNGSVLSRKDSSDLKNAKRDSINDDFRRLSFGSSIYLRPDSTGATNLIRRDSFGRRDSNKSQRIPRDYVSKVLEYKSIAPNGNDTIVHDSILRKSSIIGDPDQQTNKENLNNDLTTANLTKHVTIWEDNDHNEYEIDNVEKYLHGRRDSSGSLSNYLASRRISVDSLDVRRNSRRGSSASADINIKTINDDDEVILYLVKNKKKYENSVLATNRFSCHIYQCLYLFTYYIDFG